MFVSSSPQNTPTPDRLSKPTLPAKPGQADQGAIDYWFTCMVCHGDKGQGLTEEWRAVSGPKDMNCWQSHCHAANHPPEGFVLPHFVPKIIGNRTLLRFQTAGELYSYISSNMPWQAPGVLDEETYLNITAFLLRENGYLIVNQLSPQDAYLVNMNLPSETGTPEGSSQQDEATDTNLEEEVENFVGSTEGPSLGLLMCAFGSVLLLGGITWPVLISRRKRKNQKE